MLSILATALRLCERGTVNTPQTARERAREEITGEILAAARVRLGEVGPGALSLRAVARDVGMVSSAVYRYFPSRDDLLTALLIEAYDEVGRAAETADPGGEPATRWLAVCRATRRWALEHRHEWALLYGSPVIGYAAPRDTVTPATRVIVRLVQIAVSADPRPAEVPDDGFGDAVAGAAEAIADLVAELTTPPDPEVVGRTLMAWSGLVGVVSFELWGHLVGAVPDHDAYFDLVARRLGADIGIT